MPSEDLERAESDDDFDDDDEEHMTPPRWIHLDDHTADDAFEAAFLAEALAANPLYTAENVRPIIDCWRQMPRSYLPLYTKSLNMSEATQRFLTHLYDKVIEAHASPNYFSAARFTPSSKQSAVSRVVDMLCLGSFDLVLYAKTLQAFDCTTGELAWEMASSRSSGSTSSLPVLPDQPCALAADVSTGSLLIAAEAAMYEYSVTPPSSVTLSRVLTYGERGPDTWRPHRRKGAALERPKSMCVHNGLLYALVSVANADGKKWCEVRVYDLACDVLTPQRVLGKPAMYALCNAQPIDGCMHVDSNGVAVGDGRLFVSEKVCAKADVPQPSAKLSFIAVVRAKSLMAVPHGCGSHVLGFAMPSSCLLPAPSSSLCESSCTSA